MVGFKSRHPDHRGALIHLGSVCVEPLSPVTVCILTWSESARRCDLPGPYEGVHVFAFLSEEDEFPLESAIGNLQRSVDRERGPVFFAGLCEGAFQGFAHVAADDVPAVGELVDELLWEAGIRSDYAVEAQTHVNISGTPMGPRRRSPRFVALCRVYVNQRPTLVMQNIAAGFGDDVDKYGESLTPFVGASTVIARFHLLVQLGDEDREALDRHIGSLREIDGIDRLEVAVFEEGPT
jgi:hypothetical protein